MTQPQRILSLILTFSIFLLLAPVVILYALGYRAYQNPLHIERTGLILVRPTTNRINAYIDSQSAEKSSSPIRFAFLRPGPHRIILTREDLLSWSATVDVGPGEAVRVSPASLYSLPKPMDIPEGLTFQCRAGNALVFHENQADSPAPNSANNTKTIVIRDRQTFSVSQKLTCLSGTVIGSLVTENTPAPTSLDSPSSTSLNIFDFPPLFGDGTVRSTRLPSPSSITKIEKMSSGEVVFSREDSSLWVWTSSSDPKQILPAVTPSWGLAGRSIVRWDLTGVSVMSVDGGILQQLRWPSPDQSTPATEEDILSYVNDDGLVLYGLWGRIIIRDGQMILSDTNSAETVGYRHRALQPVVSWMIRDRVLTVQIGENTSAVQLDSGTSVIDVDPEHLVAIIQKKDGIGFISLVPSINGIQTSYWSTAPHQILDTISLNDGIAALIQSVSENEAQRVPVWTTVMNAEAF